MRLRYFVAAAALLSASLAAKADTVNFSYTNATADTGFTISGSGSFTFAGSPGMVTLSDLTSFTFTDVIARPLAPPPNSSSFTYGLGDLTSFSATDSGGVLQSLSLQTDFVGGMAGYLSESFTITSLADNGARTNSQVNLGHGQLQTAQTSTGTATVTGETPSAVTPEPSSLILLGTGLLGAFGVSRRRFA